MDLNLPILITKSQVYLICKLQEIRPSLFRATYRQNHKIGKCTLSLGITYSSHSLETPSCLSFWMSLPSVTLVCLLASAFGPTLPPQGCTNFLLVNTDHLMARWHSLLLPKNTQVSIWGLFLPMVYDLGACFTITEGKGSLKATSARPFL